MTNIKKVCKHLEHHNMLDCFMLVQPTPAGPNALAAQRLNLIANYNSIYGNPSGKLGGILQRIWPGI
eukprot:7683168-Ditylum_brightwellii.AAC.2